MAAAFKVLEKQGLDIYHGQLIGGVLSDICAMQEKSMAIVLYLCPVLIFLSLGCESSKKIVCCATCKEEDRCHAPSSVLPF
jgi:hypothetical protein